MLIDAQIRFNQVSFCRSIHPESPPVIFVVRSYIHSLKDPFVNLKNVIYKKDKAGCRWQQGTFVDGEIMKMALIMAALPWIGEEKKLAKQNYKE